ncbi:hypothetical protein FIBSPDRAFT_1049459 [Athelia psychrophila]|uniref:Uncharacterized protein n=1 Tax=Athelia psychrophila TaxID=1759441 RepID=A0A166C5Q8_9AGAM|nr:hypothetical protein FIBSPDRAFT_1049459 [Fibularhizoctonia sp. CBS 109695]
MKQPGPLPSSAACAQLAVSLFWGFEKANGSLTVVNANDDEPFLGFFLEVRIVSKPCTPVLTTDASAAQNGPLEIQDDYTIKQNNYSWSKQADTFWVDQPAGAGFSTTDADGYGASHLPSRFPPSLAAQFWQRTCTVADQEQVGEDFVGFLANLVAVWTMRGSRTSTGMPRPRWTRGTVTNEDDTYVAVMVGTQVSSLIVGVGASNKFMGGTSTGKAVSVAYGSGSFSGTEYTESVTFAGATVATSSSGFTGVDGIIGFGPVIFWVERVDARPVNTTITSLPISDVSSILANSVNATASAQRCDNIDNCRTLYDIIQSCVVTILACTWFAIHRNIPVPQPMQRHPKIFVRFAKSVWRALLDQKESLIVFLVAFLAPEWILAWALRQAIVAWKLAGQLEKARSKAIEAWKAIEEHSSPDKYTHIRADSEGIHLISTTYATCKNREGNCEQCDRVAAEKRVAKGDECWTWSHGFLAAMGGFHCYTEVGPQYPLSPANVVELVTRGHLVPPTVYELSDRSKGGWVSKGVAIVQTVWFVVQCIARSAEDLLVTRLEVMTLAYTVMTVAMYTAWWAKPLNVTCAIRVPEEELQKEDVYKYYSIWQRIGNYVLGGQDDFVDLRQYKAVPTFWAGKADLRETLMADSIGIVVAMAFGAVHCISWYSDFQTDLQRHLWRLSAVAIVAIPPSLYITGYLGHSLTSGTAKPPRLGMLLTGVMYTTTFVIYITARLVLIILSCTSLRGLPVSAYETVRWTTLIPHV